MSRPYIFSADSHIMEPATLFRDGLPASLQKFAIYTEKDGEFIYTRTPEKILHRLRVGLKNEHNLSKERHGIREIPGRLEDMEAEGLDAEICFPSLGMFMYTIDDPDAEAASCRLYNDWNNDFLKGHPNRFVRCGILPVLDFSNTIAELKYLASRGYTAAMLPNAMPAGMPKYNDEKWDPVFRLAGDLGIVFVMHTATGLESMTPERGPGGAIINYTMQMGDAIHSAMYLIGGGVLDRNPETKVAFVECGASWLIGLAERMDEVNMAHSQFVRPKLSRKPSQIMDDQIWSSFQHERAAIANIHRPGGKNIMWGSDYPHAEGSWPYSRQLVVDLFEGLDISEEDKANILGMTAARLYRQTPEYIVAA